MDVLGLLIPLAKQLLAGDKGGGSIASDQAERLAATTERIADDVGSIAANLARLVELVRQVESKFDDSGRATGWRERFSARKRWLSGCFSMG